MIRTLGWLAGSMTGTAALLGWIDPSCWPASRTPSASELAEFAYSVVAKDVPIHRGRWRNIDIAAVPSASNSGMMLTAAMEPGDCHFFIDAAGRPSRSEHWRAQLPIGDAADTVRIQVAVDHRDPIVSADQSRCVQALIAALQTALGSESTAAGRRSLADEPHVAGRPAIRSLGHVAPARQPG